MVISACFLSLSFTLYLASVGGCIMYLPSWLVLDSPPATARMPQGARAGHRAPANFQMPSKCSTNASSVTSSRLSLTVTAKHSPKSDICSGPRELDSIVRRTNLEVFHRTVPDMHRSRGLQHSSDSMELMFMSTFGRMFGVPVCHLADTSTVYQIRATCKVSSSQIRAALPLTECFSPIALPFQISPQSCAPPPPRMVPPPLLPDHIYTSCYCEENIYLLAQAFLKQASAGADPNDMWTAHWDMFVVFISNHHKTVCSSPPASTRKPPN